MGLALAKQLWKALRNLLGGNKRRLLFHGLNLAMVVLSVIMIYKSLIVVTKSERPLFIVRNGFGYRSGINKGDLLILNNSEGRLRPGEMVVAKIPHADKNLSLVRRIMNLHEKPDGTISLLTKGDDNKVNDRGIYPPGQMWLSRGDILGRVWGVIPYVGKVVIIIDESSILKYVVGGLMSLFVLVNPHTCRTPWIR